MITTQRRHRYNVTDGYIEWRDTHLDRVARGTHAATSPAPASRGRRVMPSQQGKHRTPLHRDAPDTTTFARSVLHMTDPPRLFTARAARHRGTVQWRTIARERAAAEAIVSAHIG